MQLSGVHLLLTYRCTLECEHCFVWGSPWQSGTLSLPQIDEILGQAAELGTVESIYFEGGEPFLYYATLLEGARHTIARGFTVGIVSNGYWATTPEDALACLRPFAGLLSDLSISSDLYHWSDPQSQRARNVRAAAAQLGIPIGEISIAQPETVEAGSVQGQLPAGESRVMYRGRAAANLAGRAAQQPPERFDACLSEDLSDPRRIHVDPFGYVHICQGLAIGNLFRTPLIEICDRYDPDRHAIAGPLLRGGPLELARTYDVPLAGTYADACHLCDAVRRQLRGRFPDVLAPEQMYGVA